MGGWSVSPISEKNTGHQSQAMIVVCRSKMNIIFIKTRFEDVLAEIERLQAGKPGKG
jgi:hypothetical protein